MQAYAQREWEVITLSVTTKDIALIAGVSQSTVSRSLNNSPLIPDETRKRIWKIASEHGFEFNANARSLSTSKTDTIGIIYPNNFKDFNVNLYFSSLHNQLRESLEKENLDLIVSFAANEFTRTCNIKRLINRKKIDGLIIVKSDLNNETLSFIKSTKTPFVFMHHFPSDPELEDIDAVFTDHKKGGYLAAEHLIKLGHKKILCISSTIEGEEFSQRTEGYKEALSDYANAFDEKLLVYGNVAFQSGYQIIRENADVLKGISAIFAQSDITALGVMEALRELGIAVPKDMAVVGYDDIDLCTFFKPNLTTVHQPREKIAMLTCERLVELLDSKKTYKPKRMAVQPYLVVRGSSGVEK